MNCQSRLNHVVRIGVVYNIKTPISTAMTAITMSSSISVNALLFLMIVYLLCHIRSGVFCLGGYIGMFTMLSMSWHASKQVAPRVLER